MADDKIFRLERALRERPVFMNERLEWLKRNSREAQRPDFLWHYMLQSFSTMRNRRGWKGLIGTPSNYEQVTFKALENYTPARRKQVLERIFRTAKLRQSDKKALWAAKNFQIIQKMGGVEAASDLARACKGTQAKIKFLKKI